MQTDLTERVLCAAGARQMECEVVELLCTDNAGDHSSAHLQLWGAKGIVRRELDAQRETAVLIWRVGRAHDRRLPVEEVVPDRPCAAVCGWLPLEVLKLLADALERHVPAVGAAITPGAATPR